jgi:membrane-bound lytic murein transglycosylase
MTTAASVPTLVADRTPAVGMRIVPVPAGRVSLVDRVLMQLGLALLLASSRHAARAEQRPTPRRVELGRRPIAGEARPIC